MYQIQKGIFPSIVNLLGLFLLGFAFLGLLGFVGLSFSKTYSSLLYIAVAQFLFRFLLEYMTIFSPFLLIGMFLKCQFPEIKVTRGGIKYRVLFDSLLITWDEIDDLRQLKGNIIALFFKPTKSYLFSTQYFNRLLGVLFRDDNLVILLAPGLLHRDQILDEVIEKSQVKVIKKMTVL